MARLGAEFSSGGGGSQTSDDDETDSETEQTESQGPGRQDERPRIVGDPETGEEEDSGDDSGGGTTEPQGPGRQDERVRIGGSDQGTDDDPSGGSSPGREQQAEMDQDEPQGPGRQDERPRIEGDPRSETGSESTEPAGPGRQDERPRIVGEPETGIDQDPDTPVETSQDPAGPGRQDERPRIVGDPETGLPQNDSKEPRSGRQDERPRIQDDMGLEGAAKARFQIEQRYNEALQEKFGGWPGAWFNVGDELRLVRQGDQIVPVLTETGEARLQEAQREIAGRQIEQQYNQELRETFGPVGEEFDVGDELRLKRQGDRIVPVLTEHGEERLQSIQRERAGAQIETQYNEELRETFGQVGEEFDVGDEIRLERQGDRFVPVLTDRGEARLEALQRDFAAEQAAEQFNRQVESEQGIQVGFEVGDELRLERKPVKRDELGNEFGGGFVVALTPLGRRRLVSTKILQEGEVRGETQVTELPGRNRELTYTPTRKVVSADQLVFNEKGELVDVKEPPAAQNIMKGEPGGAPDFAEKGAKALLAGLDTIGDAGEDAAGFVMEEAVNPSAEAIGEGVDLVTSGGFDFTPGAGPAVDESFDPLDESGEGQFEGYTEKVTKGVGTTATLPLTAPGGLTQIGRGIGSVGAEVVKDPEAGAAAAASGIASTGKRAIIYAENNPAIVVGTLAGGAAAVRAAGAAGGTGAARTTGALLEPGEALVTSGISKVASRSGTVARVTDRVPGDQFGPEEIVIGSAKAAGKKAESAVSRVTGRPVPRPAIGRFRVGQTRGATVGVKTVEGKVETTRPVVSVQGGSGAGAMIQTGTPAVALAEALPEGGTTSDRTPAETQILMENLVDPGTDSPGQAARKIRLFREVQRRTQRAEVGPDELANNIADVLEQHGAPREASDIVIEETKSENADIYGSLLQRSAAQTIDEPGIARTPRDIDIGQVSDKAAFSERVTEAINTRAGEEVLTIEGDTPVSVETGEKVFDIHEAGEESGESGGPSGSFTAFGVRMESMIRSDEGIRTTTLSEQTARKGAGSMETITAESRNIGEVSGQLTPGHEGRVKDIEDFYFGERANIAALRLQGREQAAAEAELALEEWLNQFSDQLAVSVRENYRSASEQQVKLADFSESESTAESASPASFESSAVANVAESLSSPRASGSDSPVSVRSSSPSESESPVQISSVRQSESPSVSVSSVPSVSVSSSPSESQSPADSTLQSESPSQSPSVLPSISPSLAPSLSPLLGPSLSPSPGPSPAPSPTPSPGPSPSPSPSPSPGSSPGPSPSPSPIPDIPFTFTFTSRRSKEESEQRRQQWFPPIQPDRRSSAGDFLVPGWLSETITDIATRGRTSGRSPTQAILEGRPFGEKATGELPTYEMLYGSAATQERITEVSNLLSGGSTDDFESITDAEMDLAPAPTGGAAEFSVALGGSR